MAKLTQKMKGMAETPQVTNGTLATEVYGGEAPTHVDIIKSANARAQKRHEMKAQHLADVEVLPDSAEMAGNEMIGVRNSGYLAKKELEFGVNALYNTLPPGMDIEDQEIADIRKMEMVVYEGGLGFPGDGWVKRPRGSQMPRKLDTGRTAETNYVGSSSLNPRNPSGN
jgi:hypothetical protein